jgi:hypothetical protein
VKGKKRQTGMYDKERSRIREAGSLTELRDFVRNMHIGNTPLLEPEFEKLLRAILNRTRTLKNEGKIDRQPSSVPKE